ncbi:MAG: hypothetical protein DMF89_18145 [Acidobacteria bacterium]|nr:MAG: hypothetical protein DMF90_16565 [Acidobacteriota bacterium]PYR47668.1 MAG: hypothetical protein DMF89_18145 [Acidobacteriota bacterium]
MNHLAHADFGDEMPQPLFSNNHRVDQQLALEILTIARFLLSPSLFDNADKAAVCSRFSSRSLRRAREKTDREERLRRAPTPLFARRSALSTRLEFGGALG